MLRTDLKYTECADWREALDNAEYWHHECNVFKAGEQWLIRHFDDPHAMTVDEIGHVELIGSN